MGMPYQWLQMRITEERERRQREAAILARLPKAIEELYRQLSECIEAYAESFGEESAEIQFYAGKIRVKIHEQKNEQWESAGKVEIATVPTLPGFRVERGTEEPLMIEVGLLPGDKLFFRHWDQFLTVEELTRRILDRQMFPKLKE